jgi:hypothetical protein
MNNNQELFIGQTIYTKSLLSNYDRLVRAFAKFVWRCPWEKLLNLYNQNISENHLEVGVGSGYFLDNCRFPSENPRIALLDINLNTLEFTSKRIQRYQPTTHIANVLNPISLKIGKFDSIGFNNVIHCLPGTIPNKIRALTNLKSLMNEGGILFGSTILGKDVKPNYLAQMTLSLYNSRRIFNSQDNLSDLKDALESNFSSYTVQLIGCSALFTARK